MKRFLFLAALAFFPVSMVSAADEVEKPQFGLHMILLDSPAFLGVGTEFFLGPVGLSAQFTMLPIGANGAFLFFYEPGLGARYYFRRNTDNSFYTGFSSHYLGAFGGDSSSLNNVSLNVIRFNGIFGYNLLVGEENKGRLAFEIGPRYNLATNTDTADRASWFFVHFQMMFGTVW